jgi:selenide,water dikinase
MAGAMKGWGAKARDIVGALGMMRQSNGAAVQVLQQYGCTAATDVTGFGLLGHALEMARASKVGCGRLGLKGGFRA